jgi:uncharacterized protein
MTIDEKYDNLQEILRKMGGVVIGFSGGVDSTFLLKVATNVLKEKAIGVIATSSTYPERELKESKLLAEQMGACSKIIETEEDKNPKFLNNPTDRCYHCKTELFTKLKAVAEEEGIPYVADGSNKDDEADFRPGMIALNELSVRSPLREADLTKDEIRDLSKRLGLSTFNKPSFACLSSRFPYGDKITIEKLQMVGAAEEFLRDTGFRTVRVRHYDNLARIELGSDEINKIFEPETRGKIIRKFKDIGYIYVTIDLEGFRSGSMNEPLFNIPEKN